MTRNWALGQAFDQSFVYIDIERTRQTHTKNYGDEEKWKSGHVDGGWGNAAFEHREYWNKYAHYDSYSHPDQYTYDWESQVDSLEFYGSHPTIERNVPVPTNAFATNCLQGRKVMFVWEAEVVENITYSDTGI